MHRVRYEKKKKKKKKCKGSLYLPGHRGFLIIFADSGIKHLGARQTITLLLMTHTGAHTHTQIVNFLGLQRFHVHDRFEWESRYRLITVENCTLSSTSRLPYSETQ